MDLEIIILNEVKQRKTNMVWHGLYVESKKIINELIYKTDRLTDIENKLMATKGRRRGKLGVWD